MRFVKDLGFLQDKEIYLVLEQRTRPNPKYLIVMAYRFGIFRKSDKKRIGWIQLRAGFNKRLRYGGNIGYGIDDKFRGHHYAGKACKLLLLLAKAHKMKKVSITCNPDNLASQKTIGFAGGKFIKEAGIPKWHDLYKMGKRRHYLYEIKL